MKSRIICVVLVVVLLFSAVVFMGIQRLEAEDTPVIYVDPSESQVAINQVFSINISVANVTNLKGFTFMLWYNTTLLDAIKVYPTDISDDATVWVPVDENLTFHWDGPPTINDTIGEVYVGCFGFTTFSGSGALLTIAFKATAAGNSALHLTDTHLLDPNADEIPSISADGEVTVLQEVYSVGITKVAVYHFCIISSTNETIVNGCYKTWTLKVSVTVLNNGTLPVNCTVNAYYFNATDTYQIETAQNITNLFPSNRTTLIFNWNCSALPVKANYTVKANVTCPCGAQDEFIDGPVKKRPWGDVNDNGKVGSTDFGDVGKVYVIYSEIITDPAWVPYGDINGNCMVGHLDFGDVGLIYLIYCGALGEGDC
jgi:hypothetical protein